MPKQSLLPTALKDTVSKVLQILGDVIKEQEGQKFYHEIEKYRRAVKKIRPLGHEKSITHLVALEKIIAKKSTKDLNKINKAFSIYLELCNSCETAYRTVKLKERASKAQFKLSPTHPKQVSFVFTAHPTEARSPQMMRIIFKINLLVQELIQFNQKSTEDKLFALISRALRTELAPHTKPTVKDEALQVSTIALRDEVLNTIKLISENNILVELRSWAGGDKDGNPFVSEDEFMASLQISRTILARHCLQILTSAQKYSLNPSVQKTVTKIEILVTQLLKLKDFDGKIITKLHEKINSLQNLNDKNLSVPEIQDFYNLLQIFPSLVMPLEFREDAAIILEASLEKSSKKSKFAITRMLYALKNISKGTTPLHYVKGLILSQLEKPSEVTGAINLQKNIFQSIQIPVIALLETKEALYHYKELLTPLFSSPIYKKSLKLQFGNQLEVMLGYSDTAKVLGSFPSRLLLFDKVNLIHQFVNSHGAELLLFHGSGGSVDRGGGPISEQVAWIPSSLIKNYKATIQGEMIARTLSSPEILLRNIEVITTAKKIDPKKQKSWKEIDEFSAKVELHYSTLIKNSDFLDLVATSTPYSYLSSLKIGSRPSKRSAGNTINVQSLRAIPWVLCWTQTRALIQTWWGVGSAWNELTTKQRQTIKKNYKHHPILNSFVKLLGFTLEKIKPSILKLYLKELGQNSTYTKKFEIDFLLELRETQKFFHEITGETSYTWYRPWLSESIMIRSPIIHILNIIQLQAIKRDEDHLLRETVTGISSGMLTTG